MSAGATIGALLVMDVQQEVVERLPADVDTAAPLRQLGLAVGSARRAGVAVIWVVIEFRAGYPEIAAGNHLLRGVVSRGGLLAGRPGTAIHSSLHPAAGEPVIGKRRTDAYTGTDLEMVLRAARADQVMLAGFTTSGVVLSTYLSAVDRDLDVVVLADACVDHDPVLHQALIERLFPSRGTVLTTGDWVSSLVGGPTR